jgi:hypothetical protein
MLILIDVMDLCVSWKSENSGKYGKLIHTASFVLFFFFAIVLFSCFKFFVLFHTAIVFAIRSVKRKRNKETKRNGLFPRSVCINEEEVFDLIYVETIWRRKLDFSR